MSTIVDLGVQIGDMIISDQMDKRGASFWDMKNGRHRNGKNINRMNRLAGLQQKDYII